MWFIPNACNMQHSSLWILTNLTLHFVLCIDVGHTSIGALGDSFYEYLIKAYIQSGGKDEVAKEMYMDAIGTITNRLVMKSVSGLTYLAESKFNRLEHKMDHLACFAGQRAKGKVVMVLRMNECDKIYTLSLYYFLSGGEKDRVILFSICVIREIPNDILSLSVI